MSWRRFVKHNLCICMLFRRLWHVLEEACKAESMYFYIIYVTLALFACFSRRLESRFYAYLRESRPFACLSKGLKTRFSPKAWRAYFLYIYVSLASFACLSNSMKSRLYAYLRDSRLLCLSLKKPPPLLVSRTAWRADLMYIYVSLAPLCLSLERLGEQILCILT